MSKIKSDAHIYISEVGAVVPTPILVTAWETTGVVKATASLAGLVTDGDAVYVSGSGSAYLDGKTWRVDNVTPTDLELPDADTTKAGTPVGGQLTAYSKSGADALLSACFVNVAVAGQAPDSINMDDMCGTSTVLGDTKPPTFTFSGFSDKDNAGYLNLWAASLANPKPTVFIVIDFTAAGGYIAGHGQIGEMSVSAANNQGLQFSGAGVFTELPTYSWGL